MKSNGTVWGSFGTLVSGAILATTLSMGALAGVAAASPCVGTCHVNRHDCAVACGIEGNCGRMFKVCKTGCKDSTVPGPDRKACLSECRAEQVSCRNEVGACKTSCADDFLDCRVECNSN